MAAEKWKLTLIKILEQLDDQQYEKTLHLLKKIPKREKEDKSRAQMAQTIIEHYGEEKSVLEVDRIMKEIPRMDSAVQKLLRPFVEKIKAGDLKSPQLDEVQPSSSWRKPIAELQNGVDLSQKIVVGKVVEKFVLRSCEANTKEKFCLAIADDSGCIEVMVYGEKAFHFFKKGHFYNFRNVIVEENMIFTTKSKTSRAGKLDVPKKLELKARMLINGQDSAVSIDEIKRLDEKKRVSVEGTVTEIGKIESVVIKKNQTEKNIQKFKLEDSTDSIDLTLWGKKNIQHLKGVSVGDTVKVTNVMTNHYHGTVSLNSTDSTRIFKLKCATLQIVQLEIIGIKKARKLQTELEAVRDEVAETFSVKSAVLAEALGIQQGTDFEDRLLEKIPYSVKAEIKGDKILKLSAMQNEERVQMRM
ncbi:hypothetical protein FQA47_005751 [Oryzias melastigma]|uniref:Pyrin domain-containing protein n=1 Tax=Oryzias melastigma TaxID=30732 RepID=A0A834FUF2_ORYME|nr:hypothetical protein FQA47_005751 [Oryzias melastigma]